jgi:hypothetical protein
MAHVDKLYAQFTPQERLSLLLEALAREDWDEARKLRQSCPLRTYSMGDAAFNDRREFMWDLALIVTADLRVILAKIKIFDLHAQGIREYATDQHALAAELSFLDGWRLGKGYPPLPRPPEEPPAEGEEWANDPMQAAIDYVYNVEGEGKEPLPERQWTRRELAEVDRWKAPTRWTKVADRRMASLYDPIVRRLAGDLLGIWAAWDAFCRAKVGVSGEVAMRAHLPSMVEMMDRVAERFKDVKPRADQQRETSEILEGAWGRRLG